MTEIPAWQSRMQLLLGDEVIKGLAKKHVLVLGLGGVGGICAEMIARGGVGKMTIVDADVVDISNINRQIAALHSTAGLSKAEVLAKRLKDINPLLELEVKKNFIEGAQLPALFSGGEVDMVADCIDTLSPKVALLSYCINHHIPVVSSMGAGGKTDPTAIQVADISKTTECTLARYVRKKLKEEGIRKGFKAVYSPELIDASRVIVSEKALPKKTLIGTISYMPALFGCTVAGVILSQLIAESKY